MAERTSTVEAGDNLEAGTHSEPYTEPDETTKYTPATGRDPSSSSTKSLTTAGAVNLGLRLTTFVFSLIAFIVMASDNVTNAAVGSLDYVYNRKLTFSSVKSFSYILAINVIVLAYCIFQIIQTSCTLMSNVTLLPYRRILACVNFIFDQMFAYLLLSAGSAGASIATEIDSVCKKIGTVVSFCNQADAAIAMTFIAFLAMALSALLSSFHLAVLSRDA